jgi:hypothetical protein
LNSTPGRSNKPRHRDHDQPGDQGLERTEKHFLNRQPRDFYRRQQAVFDLACELKFGDQRHRDRPHAGEHHADRHDPGQEQALVRGGHVAARHHDAAKDKHEHHGLQKRLQQQEEQSCGERHEHRARAEPEKSSSSIAQAPSRVVQKKILQAGFRDVHIAQFDRSAGGKIGDLGNQRASAVGVDVGGVIVLGFVLRVIWRALLLHPPESAAAAAIPESGGRSAVAADSRQEPKPSTPRVFPMRCCVHDR